MHRLLVKDDDIELGEEKEKRMLQIKERDQYLEHQTLGQRVVCPTDLVTQWITLKMVGFINIGLGFFKNASLCTGGS